MLLIMFYLFCFAYSLMAFRLTPFIIVSLLFTTKARITVVIRARGCRNCLVVRYTNRYSCCVYIRQHTIGYSYSIVWASCTLVSIYLLAFRTTETSYISSIRLQTCKRLFNMSAQHFALSPI